MTYEKVNSTTGTSNSSVNQSLSFSFLKYPNENIKEEESTPTKEKLAIPSLSKYGLDENDGECIVKYILGSFFRKYEQASYNNIKKANKFINAMSNFINQIFMSKKFKSLFAEIDDDNVKDAVSRFV